MYSIYLIGQNQFTLEKNEAFLGVVDGIYRRGEVSVGGVARGRAH